MISTSCSDCFGIEYNFDDLCCCQRPLFTCFQVSSPIEISSLLCCIKATSHHVTGCRRGHVQVKIFRDRLRTTCEVMIHLRGK